MDGALICCSNLQPTQRQAIAAAFRENVRFNKDSEPVSENMIDNILTLWNRGLSNASVMSAVLDCDARFGHNSPFDSILKMTVMVQKSGSLAAIKWVFQSIADLTRSGAIVGSISKAQLGVGSSGGGQIHLVHMLTMKLTLRDSILDSFLDRLQVTTGFKASMRKAFASHGTYRETCGFPDPKFAEAPEVDLSFQADFNKGEMLLWSLSEQLIFSTDFDSCLKQAIKARKSADEILDYGQIGEQMSHIHLELENARTIAAARVATAATPDRDGTVGQDGQSDAAQPAGGPDGQAVQQEAAAHQETMAAIKAKWIKYAGTIVRQHVKFVVEPKQQSLMTSLLQGCKAVDVVPEKGSYVLIVYDTKVAGENKYRPHLRMPPFREDHLVKLVGGVLRARSETPALSIRSSDMVAILDGGRDLTDKGLNSAFLDENSKTVPKSKRVINISYHEEAVQDSKVRKAVATLNQLERMYLFTATTLTLHERKRTIFAGSSRGNFLGPLMPQDRNRILTLPLSEKYIMYGPTNRISDRGDRDSDMLDDNMEDENSAESEQAFFHTMADSFYKELLHSYCAKSVIHLTAGDASLAFNCVECKVSLAAHKRNCSPTAWHF